jgi:alkylmercury lyase
MSKTARRRLFKSGRAHMSDVQLDRISEAILGILPALDEAERRISLSLYRLLAAGEPVSTESLARAAGADRARVERMLTAWPGVYRDAEGRVIGYWGLTIAETRHRMIIDGRQLFAWCAWDTLFLPELLGSAARVQSSCPVTGDRITLRVGPEGVDADGERPLVSFVLPDPQKVAADVVRSFCHFIHFFATERAGREWVVGRPSAVLATLDEAWALGRERNARHFPGMQLSSGAARPRSASR